VFSVEDFLCSVDPFSTKGDFYNQVYYAEQRSTIQLADWGGLVVPGDVEQVNRATSPGRGVSGQTHSRPASSPESVKQPRKKRPATSRPAAANVAKDVKCRAELRAGLILIAVLRVDVRIHARIQLLLEFARNRTLTTFAPNTSHSG
jgi:hypothetical protein